MNTNTCEGNLWRIWVKRRGRKKNYDNFPLLNFPTFDNGKDKSSERNATNVFVLSQKKFAIKKDQEKDMKAIRKTS